MPDLEQQISAWRQQMLAAHIAREAVAELECHLREQVVALVAAGNSESDAFIAAAERLGGAATLKTEFRKLGVSNYHPSLAWAAWTLFVISFFLPAYHDGFGWDCAWLSATCWTWRDFSMELSTMLLLLMTPANVVMALSPFLLRRFSCRRTALNWIRGLNLAALVLVWWYVTLLLTHEERRELRIGCYLWASSYLLFAISLFRLPERKKSYA
jgi:hypothetical protein